MKTAALHYYKGRKPCTLHISNDLQGLQDLTKWIFSVNFATKTNTTARGNVDKLICWLDECYCSWEGFADCLLNDIFTYNGELLKNLIKLLLNPDCKNADFYALEII